MCALRYRHGATREMLVNCPGSDYMGFTSHWITPRFIFSDLWLGAVTADMTSVLTYVFISCGDKGPICTFSRISVISWCLPADMLTAQIRTPTVAISTTLPLQSKLKCSGPDCLREAPYHPTPAVDSTKYTCRQPSFLLLVFCAALTAFLTRSSMCP